MYPQAIIGFYFIASTLTFILYALDKSSARGNRRRIAGNTLHLCALIGGWPGALLAQRFLHHKSKKTSFQLVFWITVALNCSAAWWLLFSAAARSA